MPGAVLLKRNARSSKFDPLVELSYIKGIPIIIICAITMEERLPFQLDIWLPKVNQVHLSDQRRAESQPDNQERDSLTRSLPDNEEPVLDNQEPEGPTQSRSDNQEPVLDRQPTQKVNQEIKQAPKQESVTLRRFGRVCRPVDRLNL